MQQNKQSNLQHFEKRRGFLELHRVFQGCFSLLKLNESDFSTTIAGKKLKFITTKKKHNTKEDILVDRLNEALNTTSMENFSSYYNFDQFNEMFGTNILNGFNTLPLCLEYFISSI